VFDILAMIGIQKLGRVMPQDILEAFQSFAETTIEVERKYQNLSQKIADHLWSERNDVVDFDKRVAPYGEVYVFITTFHGSEPDLAYSDDEEGSISGNLLTHYEIYQRYEKSEIKRIRDRKTGSILCLYNLFSLLIDRTTIE